MPTLTQTIAIYAVGTFVLAAAFSMARAFWGVHATFYLFPSVHGVSGIVMFSVVGALIGAVPFGVLFGLLVSGRAAYHAAFFSLAAGSLLVAFVAGLGLLRGSTWWVTLLDAILFVVFFTSFATLAQRIAPPLNLGARVVVVATFLLLAAFFYFGPLLYISYAYPDKVVTGSFQAFFL